MALYQPVLVCNRCNEVVACRSGHLWKTLESLKVTTHKAIVGTTTILLSLLLQTLACASGVGVLWLLAACATVMGVGILVLAPSPGQTQTAVRVCPFCGHVNPVLWDHKAAKWIPEKMFGLEGRWEMPD